MNKDNNFWIFVDETGTIAAADVSNPIFGLGILVSQEPDFISSILARIKYSLWTLLLKKRETQKDIKIPEFFHAKNDPKPFKKEFYKELNHHSFTQSQFIFRYINKKQFNLKFDELLANLNVDNRNNINETLLFAYSSLLHIELIDIFESLKKTHKNCKINIVLSKIFSNKEELFLSKSILNSAIELKIKHCNILFVDNKTDSCCQLADYFSWSCSRKIVKKEDIGYNYLSNNWNIKANSIDSTDELIKILNQFTTKSNKKTPPMESSFRRET